MSPQCLDGSLLAGNSALQLPDQPKVTEHRASILRFAGRVSVYFGLTAVDLGMWYALGSSGTGRYAEWSEHCSEKRRPAIPLVRIAIPISIPRNRSAQVILTSLGTHSDNQI